MSVTHWGFDKYLRGTTITTPSTGVTSRDRPECDSWVRHVTRDPLSLTPCVRNGILSVSLTLHLLLSYPRLFPSGPLKIETTSDRLTNPYKLI